MRKIALLAVLACAVLVPVFSGDVAHFVNLGFSADGARFFFGQHGRTDVDFHAYAEIYGVDVQLNRFLPDGVFKTEPSRTTAGRDGRGVFLALQNQAASFIRSQGIDSSRQGRPLFVQTEDGAGVGTIQFRDFEKGFKYTVQLHSASEGRDASVKSSFHLTVEREADGGQTVRRTVGLPGFNRPSVKGYRIRRVLTDESGRSVVFVVEKIQHDRNGDSIRYMVETVRF